MQKYSRFDIDRVKKLADIRDFIPNQQIGKHSFATRCPNCGASGKKGMQLTHNSQKDLGHCWSCGHSISGAISAVMESKNLNFIEAVEFVADRYGIILKSQEEKLSESITEKQKDNENAFFIKQLEESGLTLQDVTARVQSADGKDWVYIQTFRKGTMDLKGNIDTDVDDMLILYYDLYGKQRKYYPKKSNTMKPYIRLRNSNPQADLDQSGNPVKYRTPAGAGIQIYIPDTIRKAFRDKQQIETLVIQEGEKKAEKACKHGIMSVGIQGIFNIGTKETGLPKDIQFLAKECNIKNIVLLFDSDWNHLSRNLNDGDDIDQRPKLFAKAAIKFRDYIQSLHNIGAYVDIYFAHLSTDKEKGIDDLLTGSLKGRENILLEDFNKALLSHDGTGAFINCHKISTLSDFQIYDFWHLRDKSAFLVHHEDRIQSLRRFKFGRVLYVKNDQGNFVKADISGAESEFWKIEVDEKGKHSYSFDFLSAIGFLRANGFYRVKAKELGDFQFGIIKIDKGIARMIPEFEVRDFIFDYIIQNCRNNGLKNWVAERLSAILGHGQLERLPRKEIKVVLDPDNQFRSYLNGQLRITARDIEFGSQTNEVWSDNVIQRNFKRIPIIEDIIFHGENRFEIRLTKDGQDCEFLQYIRNTSYFWRDSDKALSPEDYDLHWWHMVNKITATGYLLTDYKFLQERRAVISMDAKMSEVGQSCGRSGKSLLAEAIAHIQRQTSVDGKKVKADDDYIYSNITTKTRNVLIDDVKPNFNFTSFFSAITSTLDINPKTMAKFQIPFEEAPKFMITTNHAINDTSDSANDRYVLMLFSDWYNVNHSPYDDFGHALFSEWDSRQWNLFDNFMAECVMFYLRSMQEGWTQAGRGAVPPPMQGAKQRQLRQQMGEAFLQWAQVYFDSSNDVLNSRRARKDMFDDFRSQYGGQGMFITPASFKTKLEAFCQFSNLHLNPHKLHESSKLSFIDWHKLHPNTAFIGVRDMSNGKEFFTVTTSDYAASIY